MSTQKLERMIAQFRQLRGRWIDAMTGEHDNAIWRQLAHVIHEEAWFKTVLRIRERAGNPPISAYIWDLFVTGYAIKQSLAVRRLTDRKDGTASLLRLVHEMRVNQSLLTRQVAIGHDGTPWDTSKLEEEWRTSYDDLTYQTLSDSRLANERFDRLRNVALGEPRQAGDTIAVSVFEALERALASPAIKRVRAQCDKSIAHADLSDLTNVKGPTFNDIHESVATLFRVRDFLRLDVLNHSAGPIVPVIDTRVMEHLDQPLVPSASRSEYLMIWGEVERELEALIDREVVSKFAVHQ